MLTGKMEMPASSGIGQRNKKREGVCPLFQIVKTADQTGTRSLFILSALQNKR